MSQISARVSEELADQIEAYSDETGEAKSETIRTLLQQGLEYEDVALHTQCPHQHSTHSFSIH